MAGIRKLYEEVADLYAVMIQLHLEMLACHQAQKDRETQMEELLAKMDEREQKLIAVENRVLRNMAALADLIGDPSDTPEESPGKDPANVEERLRRNIDALPTLTGAPADTPTKKELKW